MDLANTVDINVISIIVLCFVCAGTNRRAGHAFRQNRLFNALTAAVTLFLLADMASRLADGRPGEAWLWANRASTLLLYLLVPAIPTLYALYADYQVNRDKGRLGRLARPLVAYIALDWAFVIASMFTGWAFSVGEGNVYRRGPAVALHTLACFAVFLYVFAFVLANRRRIGRKRFCTLLLFGVPPAAAWAAQGLFYGLDLIGCGLALSMLMLYFDIQDNRLDTDYLTGTCNRRQLDSCIREKIRSSRAGRTFSALLIDMDDFKEINDNHGHITGDRALTDAVRLLQSCLRANDVIARYGGDEFLILLDIHRQDALEDAVARIRGCFERYNESCGKPYRLSFSIGHAVYDPSAGMDAQGFLRYLDKLMYKQKRAREEAEISPAFTPSGTSSAPGCSIRQTAP